MELNEAKRAPLNQNTNLKGARYDANTRWPEGFQIPPEANLQE
jgi:hypothetical protein